MYEGFSTIALFKNIVDFRPLTTFQTLMFRNC